MRQWVRVIILLLTLVWSVDAGQPALQIQAQPPANANGTNLQVVILLDESQSMYTNTDKNDFRGQAVRRFLDYLWAEQSTGTDHKVAIFLFGESLQSGFVTGSTANPFVSIQQSAIHQQVQAILTPDDPQSRRHDRMWTDTKYALDQAYTALKNNPMPNYRKVVIVFTDGVPEIQAANRDFPAGWPKYLGETAASAQRLADPALAYRGGCSSSSPNQGATFFSIIFDQAADPSVEGSFSLWNRIRDLTFSPPPIDVRGPDDSDRRQKLLVSFDGIISELFCVKVDTSAFQPVSGSATLLFTVSAFYDEIKFTINKLDPSVKAVVQRPNGDTVQVAPNTDTNGIRYSSSGLAETYSIQRTQGDSTKSGGWAGQWKVVLSGRGNVSLSFTPIAQAHIDVLSPETRTHPIGKPFRLEVAVLDRANQPLTVAPIRSVSVAIRDPNDTQIVTQQAAQDQTLKTWGLQLPGNVVSQEGTYVIDVAALIGNDNDQVQIPGQVRIAAVKQPWFALSSPGAPDYGLVCNGPDAQIAGKVMLGTGPASSVISLNSKIHGILQNASNIGSQFDFVLGADGTFTAKTPCPSTASQLRLHTMLTVTRPDQPVFVDSSWFVLNLQSPPPSPLPPTVTPVPPTATPIPPTATPVPPTATATPTPMITVSPTITLTPTITPTPLPPVTFVPPKLPDWAGPVLGILFALAVVAGVGILVYRMLTAGGVLNHVVYDSTDEVYSRYSGIFAPRKPLKLFDGDSMVTLRLAPTPDGATMTVEYLDEGQSVIVDGVKYQQKGDVIPLAGERSSIQFGMSRYSIEDRRAGRSARDSVGTY